MTTTSPDSCALCGGAAEHADPLVDDIFYEGVRMHLHCINSDAGREWTRRKAETDPEFARHLELSTVGGRRECAGCGALERTSPKAYGMGAGTWEMNCTSCHRSRPLLSAYGSPERRDLVLRIQQLGLEFRRSAAVPALLDQMQALADRHDGDLAPDPCECGGRYSLAAFPRCSRCATPLLESPFNIAVGPVPEPDSSFPF